MQVNVKREWMPAIIELLTDKEAKQLDPQWQWQTRRCGVKLNIAEFSDESLAKLVDYLGQHAGRGDRAAKLARTVVRRWVEIKEHPDGDHKVLKLENLEPVLRELIKTADHGFVFEDQPDGHPVPWFVHEIAYRPASGRGSSRMSAYVELTLMAENASGVCTRRIAATDLPKRLLRQVLAAKGLRLETPELMARYHDELRKFRDYSTRIGLQMRVSGKASLVEGWRGVGFRSVEKAGQPARMVVDAEPTPTPELGDTHADQDDRIASPVHAPYWDPNQDTLWPIPTHPVLHMFDLEEHALYRVHVNHVEPYVFNAAVEQNLVLPPEQKDFIRLLISHSKDTFQDVVKGKEGGAIVMLEGPPGVGKTLTAEVYAEVMERPLYRVHSSQIGIDPEKIEQALKQILARAERWGAILLIDEGDVFLHERGTDIVQNAVVGIFLRLLEYYRGVLFTTTNRGTSIDDAIVSRLTARFEYQLPSAAEQRQLWGILAQQNGTALSECQIAEIVERLPDLSGRDIKNLLKLALVASRSAGAITPDLLVRVSRFRQTRTGAQIPGATRPPGLQLVGQQTGRRRTGTAMRQRKGA